MLLYVCLFSYGYKYLFFVLNLLIDADGLATYIQRSIDSNIHATISIKRSAITNTTEAKRVDVIDLTE